MELKWLNADHMTRDYSAQLIAVSVCAGVEGGGEPATACYYVLRTHFIYRRQINPFHTPYGLNKLRLKSGRPISVYTSRANDADVNT